jgi:hypothetical protein
MDTPDSVALPSDLELVLKITTMPLPPEATYSSKEELYKAIQVFVALHHYAFMIGQSNKIHNGPGIKIFFNCERSGPPPPENHLQNTLHNCQRSLKSRKTNCQFSVVAIQHTDTQWEVRHRPGTEYSIHNHPPSDAITSYPAHQKLKQEETNQAKSLLDVGKFNNILHF